MLSTKTLAAVVKAFRELGQGLRAEEIVAATGLAESTVRAVLTFKPELPALPDFYDRGAKGWFYDPAPTYDEMKHRSMDQVCRPGARGT